LGWSPDGEQSIVVADHERLAEVSAALANDTIEDFLNDHRVSPRRWGGGRLIRPETVGGTGRVFPDALRSNSPAFDQL
jgi:hypothetical protein